jgi:hypothetical protein
MHNVNFEETLKFQDTLNYPSLLMRRINDIHMAMMQGRDGSLELSNLLSSLSKEIYEPLKPKILEIVEALEKQIEEVKKLPLLSTWSNRHWENTTEAAAATYNREAMLKIISLIIDRLDELGLLIQRERGYERGGEGYAARRAKQ